MVQWRCEACGAVYDRERSSCGSCDGGTVSKFDVGGSALDGLESASEKAESFDRWGFVDWMLLGITLGGLASMVLGLLRITGGV